MNISVDELDQRLVISHFKWWILLFVIFCLVTASFFWAYFTVIPTSLQSEAIFLNSEGFEFMRTQIEGVVTQVPLSREKVQKGEHIVSVTHPETQKTWEGVSQHEGEVIEVLKHKGEWVFEQETLVLIQKREGTFRFFSFLPFKEGQFVKEGMDVYLQMYSSHEKKGSHSYHGKVSSVSPFLVSQDRLKDLLGDENLVKFFTQGEPVVEVQIELEKGINVPPRTLAHATIVISSRRVISYLIPRADAKKNANNDSDRAG